MKASKIKDLDTPFAIFATSKGFLTLRELQNENIGGLLICSICFNKV